MRVVDTLMLSDVWVQPMRVIPEKGTIANVEFREMIYARHIKFRNVVSKIATDDLLKMLYLADCLIWDLSDVAHLTFDEWLNEKVANCVRNKGVDEANDRSKLCNYVLTEEKEFTLFPVLLKGKYGIFFRKICVHSYKDEDEGSRKLINPSMIKCKAARSDFEYILEARLLPLPDQWYDMVDLPPTQEMLDEQALI